EDADGTKFETQNTPRRKFTFDEDDDGAVPELSGTDAQADVSAKVRSKKQAGKKGQSIADDEEA
ncbi:MAG TPA: hypothetical protein VGJ26_00305, partial [Pirellulales bacterium]